MNADNEPQHSATLRLLRLLLQLPLLLVNWVLELALSRRGLSMAAIGALTLLSLSPWLRPPLSKDIRPYHLPLGAWVGSQMSPEDLIGERGFRYDSLALPLLVVCAAGACVVLFRPQELPHFSGMLVLLATAGTAAAALNHPQLIDAFDTEFTQRTQIRRLLETDEDFTLAGRNSRIDLRRQQNGLIDISEEPEEASHLWLYLAWSPWLVILAMFVTGVATEGKWRHRIGAASAWLALGLMLAGAVTWRRLAAERHWSTAESLEDANDYEGAARALDRVLDVMPDFEDTQRMWLARGRLDVRRDIDSIEALVFRALRTPGGQNDLELAVEAMPDSRVLRDLLASEMFENGRTAYAEQVESGADAIWARALRYAPWRVDSTIARAVATEHAERSSPEQVEQMLNPVIARLGDRLIRADMQSLVGDAYFEAGRFPEARKHYEASLETFQLPRFVNPHAQEAMLGM